MAKSAGDSNPHLGLDDRILKPGMSAEDLVQRRIALREQFEKMVKLRELAGRKRGRRPPQPKADSAS